MKADTYQELLKALQKLDKAIVTEHVRHCRRGWKARVERLHRAAETGGSFDAFAKVLAGRSAVRFLLRTVYVRVLEDLGLLDPPRFAGQRGLHAFREVAPALSVRAFFDWTFRDLASDFPALFTWGDDELPIPSEEICQEVWDLWHLEDGAGNVVYDWSASGDFDSRFLGDLYQDLDADVRKRYALLQTPEFVESYILDHTLTPALEAFDPAELRERGERFRLLDPTCGSGHFLIGALHRLTDYWKDRGLDVWPAMERALESVWGCDINPHAVEIARFRLLLEVMHRTGVGDLERLASLELNLRALDSLIPWEGPRGQAELFAGSDRLAAYATEEERRDNAEFLGRAFHVVVGNPPYITAKDKRKREDYRIFWPRSATGKYGLAAPFAERFFALGCHGAWSGQITGNAFTKRSYGISLIENVLPRLDLTDIVDTSGAYIPAHGTPTLIMFGRAQPPVSNLLRCLGGKRGEPKTPAEASNAKVWRAIVEAGDEPDDESPFITVSRYERDVFAEHPWNLNGGGAPELQRKLQQRGNSALGRWVDEAGPGGITGRDDLLVLSTRSAMRFGVERDAVRSIHAGESIRDYAVDRSHACTLFSYRYGGQSPERTEEFGGLNRFCSRWHRHLIRRPIKGFKTIATDPTAPYRLSFFYPDRYAARYLIPFSFVATHNHFVLSEGGSVFKQSSPVLKLVTTATLEDHLDLLGLLNSSTLGFWMKQVFFNKGEGGGTRVEAGHAALGTEPWKNHYEFDSTKLQKAPIVESDRSSRVALARALDTLAQERNDALPANLLETDWAADDLAQLLDDGEERYLALTRRMVALQEELDWLTYGSYGLLDGHATFAPNDVEPLSPGHRPFEILLARHNATCDPDERSEWFRRHGHGETTTIPEHYRPETRAKIEERVGIIAHNREVRLIEQAQFKRRWQLVDYRAEVDKAARAWLLDRLEDLFAPAADGGPPGPLAEPRPYTLETITNAWRDDRRVLAAAAIYLGTDNVDLSQLAEELLRDEALPDNVYRIYTDEGIRKLRRWQEVWRLQDREDAGEKVDIPLPDEFAKGDFRKSRYFDIRGKLNVPRERFIVYADLTPPRYGWNGWRDKERAMAQVEVFTEAETHPTDPLPLPSATDPRRCGATIGLWESLDDVRRWGEPADYAELRALAREACSKEACPCDVVKSWQSWLAGKLPLEQKSDAVGDAAATVDERAAMTRVVERLCPAPLPGTDGKRKPTTVKAISAEWEGPAKRIDTILDDLVASGDLEVKGSGNRRKFLPVR